MKAQTLVIKNARIIDPMKCADFNGDILIENGKISKIDHDISKENASFVIEDKNIIVTPSLVDMHTHVFPDVTPLGVLPDTVGVNMGVGILADAGSAGAYTFEDFKKNVICKSRTKVYEFLNIAKDGLKKGTGELSDYNNIDIEANKKVILNNREVIKGIKVRASASVVGNLGIGPVKIAKEFAKEMELPLMVHIGNAPPELKDVLNLLNKGDIVTHIYHGKQGGLFNPDGTVLKEALDAYERGVLFDVGHGTSSFNFKVAQKAFSLDIKPYTVGTDIYNQNINGPVYSLTTTLTKLVNLGLSLGEVVTLATINPRTILGIENQPIETGYKAEITVMQKIDEQYLLIDSDGNKMKSNFKLVPRYLITGEELINTEGE